MLPVVFAPGFVAKLARVGDGVEDPDALAGADVKPANVSGGGGGGAFAARPAAEKQHVLEDYGRIGVVVLNIVSYVAVQSRSHIEDAAVGKLRDKLAGVGVEAEHVLQRGREDAAIVAVSPVAHTTADAFRAAHSYALEWVKIPQHLAGGSVEGANLQLGGGDVHAAVDDNRRAFNLCCGPLSAIACRVGPGDLQLADI